MEARQKKNKKLSFRREAQRREAEIRRHVDRVHHWAANREAAERAAAAKPKRRQPPCFAPLLPPHAATTLFSFSTFQTLPVPFKKRIAAIPEKCKSPFYMTVRMKLLERKWSRPGPTFYEKLVLDVEKDHEKEMGLRFWFRALLTLWRGRAFARRDPGTPMDPITLDPIRVPISIVDYKVRRRFVFEAAAIHALIKQALLHQQYTLANPQTPRNPYTNVPFSFGQLVGLHRQLLQAGFASQELQMWRGVQFCLERFKLYMGPWLTVRAQRQELFDCTSTDGNEMLGDFIVGCLEDLERLPNAGLESLVWDAIAFFPEHAFFGRLRTLCLRELEAQALDIPIRRYVLLKFFALFGERTPLWRLVRQKREELSRAADAEQDAEQQDAQTGDAAE